MEYPRLMYRAGGAWALETGAYSLRTVLDYADMQAATAEGWCLDQYAARDAAALENAQPSRAELEQKASQLGIKIDGRWSDKRLGDAIASALSAGG